MKKTAVVAAVLLALALTPATALAQRDAVIAGKVVDQEGNPIANALVQVYSTDRGDVRDLHANDKGEYIGRGFRPEVYRIRVTADGYATVEQEVKFDFGMNTVDVTMQVAYAGPDVDYGELNSLYDSTFKAFQAQDWQKARDGAATLIDGIAEIQTDEAAQMRESALAILGSSNTELGDNAAATDAYEKLVAINPDSPDGNWGLGSAYAREGDFDKALPYMRKAAELAPDNASVQYNAGAVMMQVNDVEGGIAAMERAIELRPEFPLARKNLGYAYLRQGAEGYPKAVEMLQSYLDQMPDAADRADIEGMIAMLKEQIRQ